MLLIPFVRSEGIPITLFSVQRKVSPKVRPFMCHETSAIVSSFLVQVLGCQSSPSTSLGYRFNASSACRHTRYDLKAVVERTRSSLNPISKLDPLL